MSGAVVIVLAAGQGRRFRAAGGQVHKLDADLAGKTVLCRTLEAVQASGLACHLFAGDSDGMGGSIAAAVRATRDAPGWLILPGDMPLVAPATIRAVADALAESPVAVPSHKGRRGHPVGFAAICADALTSLTGDKGARTVVAAFGAREVETDDAGILLDIDTPVDLARAEVVLDTRL